MIFVWSTKLAHENKSFSSPPLNVWFRVAVQQITWYRSRSTYWLLIEGSIKAHWLMTLYGLKKMIYGDVFWATKLQLLHFFFFSKMATDFSPRTSLLGGRFCLRDTTTKEFKHTGHCRCRLSEKGILHLKFKSTWKAIFSLLSLFCATYLVKRW